jgi:small nuclear ribonucleoprotein (snRNP)-like protein
MNSSQYVIVELKNGNKCEGIISNIDKVNFKMYLNSAKKYFTDESGSQKEENHDTLEINKEDIKEVKLVQYEQPKDENKNINAIPESKLSQFKSQDKSKGYDKSESFFDNLSAMSNNDAKNLSIKYNDKNLETFNLPKESQNIGENNYKSRGGYRRNRGGYKRGGFKGNYNNDFNQEHANYQDNFYGGNRRGGNREGYNRGGSNFNQNYGQGYNPGYNQRYNQGYSNPNYNQGYNANYNQGYNQGYNPNSNQRQYNQNNKFNHESAYNNNYKDSSNQDYKKQESGKEKSIYDQF